MMFIYLTLLLSTSSSKNIKKSVKLFFWCFIRCNFDATNSLFWRAVLFILFCLLKKKRKNVLSYIFGSFMRQFVCSCSHKTFVKNVKLFRSHLFWFFRLQLQQIENDSHLTLIRKAKSKKTQQRQNDGFDCIDALDNWYQSRYKSKNVPIDSDRLFDTLQITTIR